MSSMTRGKGVGGGKRMPGWVPACPCPPGIRLPASPGETCCKTSDNTTPRHFHVFSRVGNSVVLSAFLRRIFRLLKAGKKKSGRAHSARSDEATKETRASLVLQVAGFFGRGFWAFVFSDVVLGIQRSSVTGRCFGGRIQSSFVGTGFGGGSTFLVRISFVWCFLLGAWQGLFSHESEGTLTVPVGESSSRRVCRRFPSTLKNNQHAKGGRIPFCLGPALPLERGGFGGESSSRRVPERKGRERQTDVRSLARSFFCGIVFLWRKRKSWLS